MPEARAEHAMETLHSGEVLVAGGRRSAIQSDLATSSAIYDSNDGTWKEAGGFVTTRLAFGDIVALEDGSALVAGGTDRVGDRTLQSAERFHPGRMAWVMAGELDTARAYAAVVALSDGRAVVTGGSSDPSGRSGFLDSTEVFDPAQNQWTPGGRMKTPRAHHLTVRLLDGRVLVLGGQSPDSLADVRLEIYDPKANAWSQAGRLINGRRYAAATVLPDGRVLVTGGSNGRAGTERFEYQSAEVFDPASMESTIAAHMLQPRIGHSLHLLTDGRVLALGGELPGAPSRIESEVYDPRLDSWQPGPSVYLPGSGHSAVTLDDARVLATGGWVTSAGEPRTTAGAALLQP